MLKIEEGGQDADGVGQSGDLRDPGGAPSRGRPVAQAIAAARAIARSYACEMHSGFPDVRDQLHGFCPQEGDCPSCATTPKPRSRASCRPGKLRLTDYKGEFLFGNLSVADCMYAPVVSRFRTYGVETSAPVEAYMDRVMALPAMQEWMKAAQAEVDAGLLVSHAAFALTSRSLPFSR